MATLLADSFTRADDVTNFGSPTTGGPYTERVGTTWGIIGNQLYTSASLVNSILTAPGAADIDFTATIVNSGASSNSGGLIWRYVDVSNFWLVYFGSGVISIGRFVAGTTIARWSSAAVYGTSVTIRVVTNGTIIRIYANGVRIWQGEDEVVSAGTAIGFRIQSSTVVRFDDVTAIDAAALSSFGSSKVVTPVNIGAVSQSKASHVLKGRDRKTLDTTVAA